jgi:Nif-specific regulatory protein
MTIADPKPTPRSSEASPAFWHTQELLLLEQVMRLVGKGLLLDRILHEMLHLMSEMLGLNRGRIVLSDDDTGMGRIRYSYGLTTQEAERGRYALGEGITGPEYR